MDLAALLIAVSALDEDALARPWSWRGRPLDVRNAVYFALQDADEALIRAAAGPHPESRRILALAQSAFGDLRGLLAGLPADLLDRAPAPDQWPVRETLRHILLTERRYAVQTRYAVDRSDSDPVRIPDDRLPGPAGIDVTGDAGAILARVADATQGKEAVTRYRVLRQGRGWSLLACTLETGRTHQIRVHLASIGHPLVGDPVYLPRGAARTLPPAARDFPRQALHATRLSLVHPLTGQSCTWESALPADIAVLVDRLEHDAPAG